MVIFTFILIVPPSTATLIIGCGLSADSMGKTYAHIRLACQRHNHTNYRHKLGGEVMPRDPRFNHAVNLAGRYRLVVEYDESTWCVCVCVCGYVPSLSLSPPHTHTHTHTHTHAVCLKRNRWACRATCGSLVTSSSGRLVPSIELPIQSYLTCCQTVAGDKSTLVQRLMSLLVKPRMHTQSFQPIVQGTTHWDAVRYAICS